MGFYQSGLNQEYTVPIQLSELIYEYVQAYFDYRRIASHLLASLNAYKEKLTGREHENYTRCIESNPG